MSFQKGLYLFIFIVLSGASLFGQNVITGTVVDSAGNKLQGANIVVPNSSIGTSTDASGHFMIRVPAGATQLEVSDINYQKQIVDIRGKNEVMVILHAGSNVLGDVVVIGYGTQRKRDVTGSISSVKGDDFKNLPVSNVGTALQGRASGVDIIQTDGSPGSVPSIRIRGTGTINNADPLVVIDGVPAGGLNDVNPNDIASIEILKDASSSAIYGSRAANGVVLITTRKGSFNQQPKTSVNLYTGTNKAIKYLNMLSAPDLAQLKTEAFANDSLAVPAIWSDPYYAV
ncbi:MAG: TonB-dependent receptor plug domain-containing protein, partial [Bacteroidota bacterium]|nr:TonB-dependent receptor plug domain-containing protein [Bacteroidota bacterium]